METEQISEEMKKRLDAIWNEGMAGLSEEACNAMLDLAKAIVKTYFILMDEKETT